MMFSHRTASCGCPAAPDEALREAYGSYGCELVGFDDYGCGVRCWDDRDGRVAGGGSPPAMRWQYPDFSAA